MWRWAKCKQAKAISKIRTVQQKQLAATAKSPTGSQCQQIFAKISYALRKLKRNLRYAKKKKKKDSHNAECYNITH